MIIKVRTKIKSGEKKVTLLEDGIFEVHVQSVPEKGKANKEIIDLLSQHFKIPKANISIISGARSRFKKVLLIDPRA